MKGVGFENQTYGNCSAFHHPHYFVGFKNPASAFILRLIL